MPLPIDLDNNATTSTLPEAITAVVEAMAPGVGNPSSAHRKGRSARDLVDAARKHVAAILRADDDAIVFTSGATEGNDAVLRMQSDRVLLTMAGAHPSLVAGHPGSHTKLAVDKNGLLNLCSLWTAIKTNNRAIVVLPMVSGETGVIQPIREICEIATSVGVPTLIDQSQAVGRVSSDLLDCGATYRTVSAHKMNGPKGVGCLVMADGAPVPPLAAGGGQEGGRRSGTENVPGIAGFGAASRVGMATLDANLARMSEMRDRLEQRITVALPFVHVNGQSAPRSATTTSLTFAGVDGMALVARLDAKGVLCSQVSACSSGRPEPSATLMSMGLTERDAFSTIRFSVSVMTSTEDLEDAASIIIHEASFLHDIMRGSV